MTKKIRVLHFSSRSKDNCGVGKYQENFVNRYKDDDDLGIETDFFDVSPYQTRRMTQDEINDVMHQLRQQLKDYDILHIQHEFGLYSGTEFAQLVETAKSMGKKVIVTVHLSPALAFKFKPREGVGLRSAMHVVRQRRLHGIFIKRHIEPMQRADLIITHNNAATKSLVGYGISKNRILQIKHPVLPQILPKQKSTEITEKLRKDDSDIIYSTIGFMHKYKGVEDAMHALKFLPENYKLAIIGGMQPISDEKNIYNKIADLIDTINLKDRVYITGYVEDDDRLNALIRETDVCVYPYNNAYYGQVSSGALNLAFANERPVIAYPTDTFKESNDEFNQIVLTSAQAYYELARELQRVDVDEQKKRIAQYAEKYSWDNAAQDMSETYHQLNS